MITDSHLRDIRIVLGVYELLYIFIVIIYTMVELF